MPTTETRTTPTAAVELPDHRADGLLLTLIDRLGARFTASMVFGAPVEREGVTVVPVAVARFGFGGGAGRDRANDQVGEGAGAGGTVAPAGYIELKDGAADSSRSSTPPACSRSSQVRSSPGCSSRVH